MMPRKPRRSSILKPPKQVVRAPLQELDSDDEGTLTQPTSRRVSFSRTSQIKEFDPSIGYMTKWNQSYEESLESIEGDENQAKSANVQDDFPIVQTQKKFKRKRTSTVQLSLNSSNIEISGGVCSVVNQSLQQNSGARAVKQPRKSLDCFKTEFVEEGDTSMFFDELNLTEPIKGSYSHIDSSTNLTRTMMDSVFDCSDTDLCQNKIDLVTGSSSENESKCIEISEKSSYNSEEVIVDTFPIKETNVLSTEINANISSMNGSDMDMTLAGGGIEVSKNDLNNSSVGPLPLSPILGKDIHFKENKEHLKESNPLEISMDLTLPQVRIESALPKGSCKKGDIQVCQDVKDDLETEDLEMTGTWGKILDKRNSIVPSDVVDDLNVVRDKPESHNNLTNGLNADKECIQEKIVDSSVSSDMELSMTNGGIAILGNVECRGLNSSEDSCINDETCAGMDGMELTVALGKVNMLKASDDLETTDYLKPLEVSEPILNSTAAGKNFEEGLPKEMTERSCVEGIANDTNYFQGLDETCAEMHGMEMTVPLGKIKERISKPVSGNDVQNFGAMDDPVQEEQLKNEVKLDKFPEEGKENLGALDFECQVANTRCQNNEIPSHVELQVANEIEFEAEVVKKTPQLQQAQEEQCENAVDNTELHSQIGDRTNSEAVGMDVTVPLERQKERCNDPVNSSLSQNLKVDDTNPDTMGMELTISLGKLEGEMSSGVTVSQVVDVTSPESVGMEITLPVQSMRRGECEAPIDNEIAESHEVDHTNPDASCMELTVPLGRLKGGKCKDTLKPLLESQITDDTNPETMGMELTVPLGGLKGDKHEGTVDNVLLESHVVDETIPDTVGMELTVPLGRLKREKCDDPIDNVLLETQMVNNTETDVIGIKLTVPQGKLKEEKLLQIEGATFNTMAESQILCDTIPNVSELSVPMAELKEGNTTDFTANVIEESVKADDTNPDAMGMELTVALGGLKGEKYEDHVPESVSEYQMVYDTNTETVGMESAIKTAEPEEDNVNLSNNIITGLDNTRWTMNLTASLEGLKGGICEDQAPESIAGSQMKNDDNTEGVGMESAIQTSELKGENIVNADDTITDFQQLDVTNSGDIDMEFTVPLGRLKGKECNAAVDKMLPVTQTMNGTVPEVVGMEETAPLGWIKGNEYEEMGQIKPTEFQMVNEIDPKSLDMKSPAILEGLEEKNQNPCDDNAEEPQVDGEPSIKEFDRGKSDVVTNTVNETENNEAVETINVNSVVNQSLRQSEEQGCGGLVDNTVTKPIFEDDISKKGKEGELNISFRGADEQEGGDPVTIEFIECETEVDVNSRDVRAESNLPSEKCDMGVIQDLEGKAVNYEGREEITPEQVDMELSLSEAMIGEPKDVDIVKMEFQALAETSINGCEMMEVNSPINRPQTPKVKDPVHNAVTSEPLGIQHTSGVHVDSSVIPVSNLENEQQLEGSISERKVAVCEELVSSTEWILDTEREACKETDVTKQDQKKFDGNAEMELTVPLGKLKSQEKESKMAAAQPSRICNNDYEKCDNDHSNNRSTSQLALANSNSINNNEPGATDVDVVPVSENKEQLHEPLFAPVNSVVIPVEEVAMECVTFSDRDTHEIDDDCIEPMDDQDIDGQENLEPNKTLSCEVKSELDNGSMEEPADCDVDHELSNLEEMRDGTSFLATDASDSSVADITVNTSVQDEVIKTAISVEDWIKEESSKESCDWTVYKLLENQLSFMVYHDLAVLIVNLKPLQECQDSKDNRIVENVVLKSCIADSDWCLTVVFNVMLKRLPSSLLSSTCSSTEQLPSLFDFLGKEFLAMDMLLLQAYDLMRACPVKFEMDGFSFRVPSMKRMLLFEVQVDLLNWDKDGVKAEDVKVRNIIGKMGVTDIQSIVQSVKCDDHYFRNVYKEVFNFIFTLEKVLE